MKYQYLRYLFVFLGYISGCFHAQEVHAKYQNLLNIYTLYTPNTHTNESCLIEISHAIKGAPLKVFLKQLSQDIRLGRRKKLEKEYIAKLQALYNFIQHHAQFFYTYNFHKELEVKYAFAFDNPCVAQTVSARYGGKLPLHQFMKDLQRDLAELEYHEDKLHSRYGYLKSHNHALKIELIKIRNSIIYQDIYKEQCSLYARQNWWKAPFKLVEGICVGSYCVGSYLWNAVTG